ncbi:MAG: hypothetical protein ABIQ60_00245 [Burkholderiaceae bacterium]
MPMRSRWLPFFVLSLALIRSVAAAAPGDPLESVDCRRALDALGSREGVVAAQRSDDHTDRAAPDARLQALRRNAAFVCLGSRADASRPARPVVRRPLVVEPSLTGGPAPLRSPAAVRNEPAAAEPGVPPPTVVTTCDPAGCWSSDGSRLIRAGAGFIGPGGWCSVQGSVLQCP